MELVKIVISLCNMKIITMRIREAVQGAISSLRLLSTKTHSKNVKIVVRFRVNTAKFAYNATLTTTISRDESKI